MSEIPICRYSAKKEILNSIKNKVTHVASQYCVKTKSHDIMPKKYTDLLNKMFMVYNDVNILKNEKENGIPKLQFVKIKTTQIPKHLFSRLDPIKFACKACMINIKLEHDQFIEFEIENKIKLNNFKIIK